MLFSMYSAQFSYMFHPLKAPFTNAVSIIRVDVNHLLSMNGGMCRAKATNTPITVKRKTINGWARPWTAMPMITISLW